MELDFENYYVVDQGAKVQRTDLGGRVQTVDLALTIEQRMKIGPSAGTPLEFQRPSVPSVIDATKPKEAENVNIGALAVEPSARSDSNQSKRRLDGTLSNPSDTEITDNEVAGQFIMDTKTAFADDAIDSSDLNDRFCVRAKFRNYLRFMTALKAKVG